MVRKLIFAIGMIGFSSTAQATWRTATSNHFVIYTEGSEARARETAEKLEKFEFVLAAMSGVHAQPGPIKIQVYMLPDDEAVQQTMAFPSGSIAGYYSDDIRGPFAVMTRSKTSGEFGLGAQLVLFHELSHQFMFHNFPAAYPSWYVEGFADFYGAVTISDKDVVTMGKPVNNRYLAFSENNWVPLQKILSARNYSDVGDTQYIYSEGWLLVNYLTMTKKRPDQLGIYLKAINNGAGFEQAAAKAFGDLKKLDGELRNYASLQVIDVLDLPFKKIDTGPIVSGTLTAAQSAMVPFEIRLRSGIANSGIEAFAKEALAAAAVYPDDPAALAVAADTALLAKRNAQAQAIVSHWLNILPDDPKAMMFKGLSDLAVLKAAGETKAAGWSAARRALVLANAAKPDDPRILRGYYAGFVAQGISPPKDAENALLAAFDLMPESEDLRQMVAADYEARGLYREAIATIRPTAYVIRSDSDLSPKEKARRADSKAKYSLAGDTSTETAREMLTRLEAKLAGQANAAPSVTK